MSIAYKISAFNRKRKWRIFSKEINLNPASTILDVGFSEEEFSETDNYLEKNYPYPDKITALGIDTADQFLTRYPKVKVVKYDGIRFPFIDKSFDFCWSNAVIEHVGNRRRQVVFLKEISRVAKSGFITTPNKHFPIEVHTRTFFLHFLPRKYFDIYLSLVGKSWATGDYMHLLSLDDIESLLKEAGITKYKIISNKLFFFTLDFVIIFGDF